MAFNEAYEMREFHRQLLTRNRVYLLHNLRPTEALWSTLIAKGLFNTDMIEDIKSHRITSEKVCRLLDLLPARGPNAYDQFCEALLECDHGHVAEYLKTLEATDQFKNDIQPHCQNFSENVLDKFVTIFKKSTPTVQRFAERKFEIILAEQEKDLNQREAEVKELESQNMYLQLEVSQLRSFLGSCSETTENVVSEVQRDFVSMSFIREEKKHLENMKYSLTDINGFEKACSFYSNMQALLTYLESHAGVRVGMGRDAKGSGSHLKSNSNSTIAASSLPEKMQTLVNSITQIVNETGTRAQVPGLLLRTELEKILRKVKEIIADVLQIRDVFKNTMKQKRKLEKETLSLLHNFREIRRLEREFHEKQNHMAELNKHAQLMKKKSSRTHRKQLENIQLNMQQKKIQAAEIQKILERHISSADVRHHHLLNLLPDLEDNDYMVRSDTELTTSTSSTSRGNTPDLFAMAASDGMLQIPRMNQLKRSEPNRRTTPLFTIENMPFLSERTRSAIGEKHFTGGGKEEDIQNVPDKSSPQKQDKACLQKQLTQSETKMKDSNMGSKASTATKSNSNLMGSKSGSRLSTNRFIRKPINQKTAKDGSSETTSTDIGPKPGTIPRPGNFIKKHKAISGECKTSREVKNDDDSTEKNGTQKAQEQKVVKSIDRPKMLMRRMQNQMEEEMKSALAGNGRKGHHIWGIPMNENNPSEKPQGGSRPENDDGSPSKEMLVSENSESSDGSWPRQQKRLKSETEQVDKTRKKIEGSDIEMVTKVPDLPIKTDDNTSSRGTKSPENSTPDRVDPEIVSPCRHSYIIPPPPETGYPIQPLPKPNPRQSLPTKRIEIRLD